MSHPPKPVKNSKRAYADLADYVNEPYFGVSVDEFRRCGWSDSKKKINGRPAISFKTETGIRHRYIDGKKPPYHSPKGYKPSWYYLKQAAPSAIEGGRALVICNGERSTIVAQYHGVPACTVTAGEKPKLPPELLNKLKSIYPTGKIIVALDCDNTGRNYGPKLAAQLTEAGYEARAVDLVLEKGGDLADFCASHRSEAYEALERLPSIETTIVAKPRGQGAPKTDAPAPNIGKRNLANSSKPVERYVEKAVDNVIGDLAGLRDGQSRHDAIYAAAAAMGEFVGAGVLSEAEARTALISACHQNQFIADHSLAEAESHIDRGLKKGIQNPRDLSGIGQGAAKSGGGAQPAPNGSGASAAAAAVPSGQAAMRGSASAPSKSEASEAAPFDLIGLVASVMKEAHDPLKMVDPLATAIMLCAPLPPGKREAALNELQKAAKPIMNAAQFREFVRNTLQIGTPNGSEARFRILDGEIVTGHGPATSQVTIGGRVEWTGRILRTDGMQSRPSSYSVLSIVLKSGAQFTVEIESEYSGNSQHIREKVRGVVANALTFPAAAEKILPEAIDAVSAQFEPIREIAHTGWHEEGGKRAFLTGGSVIGELPSNTRVHLEDVPGADRYVIEDKPDDQFIQGLRSFIEDFMIEAYGPQIGVPWGIFGVLPPLAGLVKLPQKFWLHITGETGTQKTSGAQVLMSLYGPKFANTPPLANFRSTQNSIERQGSYYADVLGLIDDYKPSLVKAREFYEGVHRYADNNDRARMNSRTELHLRKPPRWWVVSTGEDIPQGESSVLARMIILRLPRRPDNALWNEGLEAAQRNAHLYSAIMYRWIQWLMRTAEAYDLAETIMVNHRIIVEHLGKIARNAPNSNRIAQNIALLWAVYELFKDFAADASNGAVKLTQDFKTIALRLAASQAGYTAEEKPSAVFVSTIQEYLDSESILLCKRSDAPPQHSTRPLAGWYDADGVYLLTSAYDEMAKRKGQSGQPLTFSRPALFEALKADQLIKPDKSGVSTVNVRVGTDKHQRRVLHFRPGVFEVPDTDATGSPK